MQQHAACTLHGNFVPSSLLFDIVLRLGKNKTLVTHLRRGLCVSRILKRARGRWFVVIAQRNRKDPTGMTTSGRSVPRMMEE